MIEYVIIAILTVIITLLLAERYFSSEHSQTKENKLLEENSRLVKAVIAKNANEYVMTTSIDKVPSEEKPARDPDEIPEEALSDDQFFDAIGKGLKEESK